MCSGAMEVLVPGMEELGSRPACVPKSSAGWKRRFRITYGTKPVDCSLASLLLQRVASHAASSGP